MSTSLDRGKGRIAKNVKSIFIDEIQSEMIITCPSVYICLLAFLHASRRTCLYACLSVSLFVCLSSHFSARLLNLFVGLSISLCLSVRVCLSSVGMFVCLSVCFHLNKYIFKVFNYSYGSR